jgi:hypothetical protein
VQQLFPLPSFNSVMKEKKGMEYRVDDWPHRVMQQQPQDLGEAVRLPEGDDAAVNQEGRTSHKQIIQAKTSPDSGCEFSPPPEQENTPQADLVEEVRLPEGDVAINTDDGLDELLAELEQYDSNRGTPKGTSIPQDNDVKSNLIGTDVVCNDNSTWADLDGVPHSVNGNQEDTIGSAVVNEGSTAVNAGLQDVIWLDKREDEILKVETVQFWGERQFVKKQPPPLPRPKRKKLARLEAPASSAYCGDTPELQMQHEVPGREDEAAMIGQKQKFHEQQQPSHLLNQHYPFQSFGPLPLPHNYNYNYSETHSNVPATYQSYMDRPNPVAGCCQQNASVGTWLRPPSQQEHYYPAAANYQFRNCVATCCPQNIGVPKGYGNNARLLTADGGGSAGGKSLTQQQQQYSGAVNQYGVSRNAAEGNMQQQGRRQKVVIVNPGYSSLNGQQHQIVQAATTTPNQGGIQQGRRHVLVVNQASTSISGQFSFPAQGNTQQSRHHVVVVNQEGRTSHKQIIQARTSPDSGCEFSPPPDQEKPPQVVVLNPKCCSTSEPKQQILPDTTTPAKFVPAGSQGTLYNHSNTVIKPRQQKHSLQNGVNQIVDGITPRGFQPIVATQRRLPTMNGHQQLITYSNAATGGKGTPPPNVVVIPPLLPQVGRYAAPSNVGVNSSNNRGGGGCATANVKTELLSLGAQQQAKESVPLGPRQSQKVLRKQQQTPQMTTNELQSLQSLQQEHVRRRQLLQQQVTQQEIQQHQHQQEQQQDQQQMQFTSDDEQRQLQMKKQIKLHLDRQRLHELQQQFQEEHQTPPLQVEQPCRQPEFQHYPGGGRNIIDMLSTLEPVAVEIGGLGGN